MALTQKDYPEEIVKAAKSVLIELVRLLDEYQDDIVVIGGWVPGLQYTGHIGSLDVDLALNHMKIINASYKKIEALLLVSGYIKDNEKPFRYWRKVNDVNVAVDFLAGEYSFLGKSTHQQFHDLTAISARGSDIVFTNYMEHEIVGVTPDGKRDTVKVRLAGIGPSIVMKSFALGGRKKEKDAYDIYISLLEFPGGVDSIITEFRRIKGHGLVKEALEILAEKFQSPEHAGPVDIVNFLEIDDEEERQRIQRDAFERVDYLVRNLS